MTTHARNARRAFTIIELMIVIGVMVLLIAILVPSLAHVKRAAMKAAAQTQLNSLQSALNSYYGVFHVYPASGPAYGPIFAGRGSCGEMLAEGLVGFMDSTVDGAGPTAGDATAYGFRANKNGAQMGGAVYGPYAPMDAKGYKVLSLGADEYFIDPWGQEILYFRSTQSPPNTTTGAAAIFGTANSLFVSTDAGKSPSYVVNDPSTATAPFFQLLGATGNSPGSPSTLGADSFLLISAGPDGVYFTGDDVVAGKQ